MTNQCYSHWLISEKKILPRLIPLHRIVAKRLPGKKLDGIPRGFKSFKFDRILSF